MTTAKTALLVWLSTVCSNTGRSNTTYCSETLGWYHWKNGMNLKRLMQVIVLLVQFCSNFSVYFMLNPTIQPYVGWVSIFQNVLDSCWIGWLTWSLLLISSVVGKNSSLLIELCLIFFLVCLYDEIFISVLHVFDCIYLWAPLLPAREAGTIRHRIHTAAA